MTDRLSTVNDNECSLTRAQRNRAVQKKHSVTRQNSGLIAPICGNKCNVFVKLGLFFKEPEYNQHVIELLLDDQLNRNLLTIDKAVDDLDEYCQQFYNTPNDNCRAFIYATCKVSLWCYNHTDVLQKTRNAMQRIHYLLQHHKSALRKLLMLLCKPDFTNLALFMDLYSDAFLARSSICLEIAQVAVSTLEAILQACVQLKIQYSPGQKFINMPLGFGETLLVAATRFKCEDTIKILLKYGADTRVKWLGFEHCLEVLLFSPTVVHCSDLQIEDSVNCLNQLLLNTKYINIKRLQELSREYHAIIPNWEEILKYYVNFCEPMSLRHLCRCIIRESLVNSWNIPESVDQLPLPSQLLQYIDSTRVSDRT